MSTRVYVNQSGGNAWSPNTKEQLCEAVMHLAAECDRLRRLLQAKPKDGGR